ncbi:phage shock protein PspA [Aeromonas caviae]|uniref:phage shock protein PspA n=2 Tax=Aeromonas caviae TaxID=648 RepID=UPI0020B81296|nr:phage shock protein PspA [Aeromonas caviae]UTI02183.1 phage shock protein PspA [Aeromonas caviae]
MSVFSRLTDVINANLHSLLDKSEEPEKMLRLMIEEMEQVQVEMRTQAARVIAEQKQLERHQQALRNQIQEWAAKAELAIQKGREDLARAALTEKLAEMKQCERLEEDKARVAEVLAQLTADSERLAAKLTEAREKQKMLTLREQTAHSRIRARARAQVDNQRMHELVARFDGFQNRVDQLEAQLEAATLGQNPSLEAQFRELELNDEIERELARLKGQKVEA